MKGLRHVLVLIFLFFTILIVVGLFLPHEWAVEERTRVAAPPSTVFEQVASLRNWEAWAVWFEHDPAMSRHYTGPESGPGSTYTWEGNRAVGEGTITVDELVPGESIAYTLTMHDGEFVSRGKIHCRAAAGEPTASEVVWHMGGSFGRDPFARYYRKALQAAVRATLGECLDNLEASLENASPVNPAEESTP